MMFEKWKKAIEEFNVALETNKHNAQAYYCRAQCWGQLGNRENAMRDGQLAECKDGIKRVLRETQKAGLNAE